MVGGSTTGEIHFGRHTDVEPPMRCARRDGACMLDGGCAKLLIIAAAAFSCLLAESNRGALPANLTHRARFEAGTPAIAEAIGLGAACDYLSALGWGAIDEHEQALARQLYDEVASVPGARILGPPPSTPLVRRPALACRRRLERACCAAEGWKRQRHACSQRLLAPGTPGQLTRTCTCPPARPHLPPTPAAHACRPCAAAAGARRAGLLPGGGLRRDAAGRRPGRAPHRGQVGETWGVDS